MQMSIVAYARNQPYVEVDPPIREVLTDYNIFVPPEAPPEAPPTTTAPSHLAREPAKRPVDRREPAGTPLTKSQGKSAVARSRGLVAVIGALREDSGPVQDLFDEGRIVPSIKQALDGARGVD